MKKSLMQYMACPSCGAGLQLSEPHQEDGLEVISGLLLCPEGHAFPVTEGVPRMVVSDTLETTKVDTQRSFSEKWAKIPDYGHDSSTREFQLRWYLQRYGWNSLEGLTAFLSTRRFILDAGTGTGRDTKLYAENTGGQVFGIDISRSVDAAYAHTRHLPNAHIIQADLTRLPFPRRFFDFVVSDQVLHHTPDTAASFKYLTGFLEHGGQIAIYVYKKKGPVREFCDDYIRSHTTKLEAGECYEFARAVTRLGKALSDQKTEITVPEDIPYLQIRSGTYDLQRFVYWNILKCFWNDDFDFETNVMVNFDWYHPRDAHRHTPDEVASWFEDARLEILHFDVGDSGISARGMKCAA